MDKNIAVGKISTTTNARYYHQCHRTKLHPISSPEIDYVPVGTINVSGGVDADVARRINKTITIVTTRDRRS